MLVRVPSPNRAHRAVQRLAGTRPLAWAAARTFHRLDGLTLRLTRGRRTLSGLLTGLPVLTLITTGARSGLPRHSPLLGLPDGEAIVIIGTNFGQRRHPSWYYNLRANPHAAILLDGRSTRVVAREVIGAERERYWPLADAVYLGYAAYRRRVGDRRIPIMVLVPLPDIPAHDQAPTPE